MKKSNQLRTVLTMLLMFFAIAVNAQDDTADKAKEVTDNMKEKLTLSDDQYKKVYDVNYAFVSGMQGLKNDTGGRLQKAKKFKKLSDDRDDKLESILTDSQYEAFEDLKAENRKKMKDAYKNNQ